MRNRATASISLPVFFVCVFIYFLNRLPPLRLSYLEPPNSAARSATDMEPTPLAPGADTLPWSTLSSGCPFTPPPLFLFTGVPPTVCEASGELTKLGLGSGCCCCCCCCCCR